MDPRLMCGKTADGLILADKPLVCDAAFQKYLEDERDAEEEFIRKKEQNKNAIKISLLPCFALPCLLRLFFLFFMIIEIHLNHQTKYNYLLFQTREACHLNSTLLTSAPAGAIAAKPIWTSSRNILKSKKV